MILAEKAGLRLKNFAVNEFKRNFHSKKSEKKKANWSNQRLHTKFSLQHDRRVFKKKEVSMNAYLEKKCVDRTERHIYFPEKPDGSAELEGAVQPDWVRTSVLALL